MTRPLISVVVPAYNEQDCLRTLKAEVEKVLGPLDYDWEIVFVDDGSQDSTWEVIASLNIEDGRVRGLRLSRNFGHQNALFAGLEAARGDAIITMDGDLQHPPDLLPEMLARWESGFLVVAAVRAYTEGARPWKRLTSAWFYRLFRLLTGVQLQDGMADFRLMDRRALAAVLSCSERAVFLRGLVSWVGFPYTTVAYEARQRFAGSSQYSVRKMLRLAANGITSFSAVPLRLSLYLGGGALVLGTAYAVYVLAVRLLTTKAVPGWSSLALVVLFMSGLQFVLLGFIGEYVARVFDEVKGRPRYFVASSTAERKSESGMGGAGRGEGP